MEIKTLTVGILQTNCYLLVSQGELAVVDPGGDLEKILKEIEKTKANAKYILNTHNHPDHTFYNEELSQRTNAKILTGLKENDELKIGDSALKIIHTPGHTKESICLMGNDFILTGDTLFKEGHGRTDLPGGSQEEIEKSLERLSIMLKPGTIVYPGHGPSFKINPVV